MKKMMSFEISGNENEVEMIVMKINKALLQIINENEKNGCQITMVKSDILSGGIKEESNLEIETNGDRVLRHIMSNKGLNCGETETSWSDSWCE